MRKTLLLAMGLMLFAVPSDWAAAPTPTPQPTPTVQAGQADVYDIFILKKKGRDKIQLLPDFNDENIKLEKPSDDDMVIANKDLEQWKEKRKKTELVLGLGGAFNLSENLSKTYTPGFSYEIEAGHRFSPQFSLLLDFDGSIFWLNNDPSKGSLTLSTFNFAALAKLRLAPEGVRPYLFFGPGIGVNYYSQKYSFNGLDGNDTLFSGGFIMEGGVGVEAPLTKFIYLFVQGKVIYQFVDGNFAAFTGMDDRSVYIPVEIGVTFAK